MNRKSLNILIILSLIFFTYWFICSKKEHYLHAAKYRYVQRSSGFFGFLIYDITRLSYRFFLSKEIHFSKNNLNSNKDFLNLKNVNKNNSSKILDLNTKKVKPNIIFVLMESVDSVIAQSRFGNKEVMPFLQKLRMNSIQFNNAFDLTGIGNTTDAEFMIQSSNYPLKRRSLFTFYKLDKLESFVKQLKKENYYSFSIHGNYRSVYRRQIRHDELGFDKFISYKDMNKLEKLGPWISDRAVFKKSIDLLISKKMPVFALIMTITNHFPFKYLSKKKNITKRNSLNYINSLKELDQNIEYFWKLLKEKKLIDDSIIVFFSDHTSRQTLRYIKELNLSTKLSYPDKRIEMFIYYRGVSYEVNRVSSLLDLPVIILDALDISIPHNYLGSSYLHYPNTLYLDENISLAYENKKLKEKKLNIDIEMLTINSLNHDVNLKNEE